MRVLTVEVKLIKHTVIYRYLSLSGDTIKAFKDISKKEICLKIDNLKPDMLRKINKISFPIVESFLVY